MIDASVVVGLNANSRSDKASAGSDKAAQRLYQVVDDALGMLRAKAFVRFQLEPETQARIAAFKSDRFSAPPFLPAGRTNVDESIASASRK